MKHIAPIVSPRGSRTTITWLAAAVVGGLCLSPTIGAQSNFVTIDLGTLGGSRSSAVAVNDAGQVVGWSGLDGAGAHAFSWTAAGGMIDLGTLGGSGSYASAVNDAGQVVGNSSPAGEPRPRVFVDGRGRDDRSRHARRQHQRAPKRSMMPARSLAQLTAGDAVAHAFSWTAAGGMIDLGTLGGCSQLSPLRSMTPARSLAAAYRRRCASTRFRGRLRAG